MTPLTVADIERLKALDTCTVSNAIERFDVRLRNEGFARRGVSCLFPQLPPMVGYAVTATVKSSIQPMTGGIYYDRIDWWSTVLTLPAPRVLVLQDVDAVVGCGAFVGEVHANIARALGCIGCVTNGAVRDVPAAEALGFQMFAGSLSPSHAYAHIVGWGEPVEIGGLKIAQGDLVHGDRHGFLTVPASIAARVPDVAATLIEQERALLAECQKAGMSIETLRALLARMGPSANNTRVTGGNGTVS
ncbi:MAG: RraA family protein [Acidobacteriaceae bacterium]|nr:RraA family protein [Acidobacteriaceae bacterium]